MVVKGEGVIARGGLIQRYNRKIRNFFVNAFVEKRADSLAICQAAAGTVGFLATLCVSPFVSLIQANGNTVFGITVYAQQLLSAFGVAAVALVIIFVRAKLMKKR